MKIKITKSRPGWPLIKAGEIYTVARQTKEDFICDNWWNGHNWQKHIPKDHAQVIENNGQLFLKL